MSETTDLSRLIRANTGGEPVARVVEARDAVALRGTVLHGPSGTEQYFEHVAKDVSIAARRSSRASRLRNRSNSMATSRSVWRPASTITQRDDIRVDACSDAESGRRTWYWLHSRGVSKGRSIAVPTTEPAGGVDDATEDTSPGDGQDELSVQRDGRVHDAQDEKILERLARGDRSGAETELFKLYSSRILARCFYELGRLEAAEDVCQQVFLEACRGLDRFEHRSSLYTWLCSIARHRCLDAIKAERGSAKRFAAEDTIESEMADGSPTPDELVDRGRCFAALDECLQELSEPVRETVRLRFQSDSPSYEQMASRMSTSPGTLNQRVVRALRLLAECLERKGWTGD
jgi:RNA polymerase sigma factor (sigma-70 family)